MRATSRAVSDWRAHQRRRAAHVDVVEPQRERGRAERRGGARRGSARVRPGGRRGGRRRRRGRRVVREAAVAEPSLPRGRVPAVLDGVFGPAGQELGDLAPAVAVDLRNEPVNRILRDARRLGQNAVPRHLEVLYSAALPRTRCVSKRTASSSGVQSPFLMSGSRWLNHRSRHCLPMRPGSCAAITLHLMFPAPWRSTMSRTTRSSAAVHLCESQIPGASRRRRAVVSVTAFAKLTRRLVSTRPPTAPC